MEWACTDITRSLFRHGAQNAYDAASKATLENEFGTSNEDECMIKILEKGDLQHTEVSRDFYLAPYTTSAEGMMGQTGERQGPKNDTIGARQAH